MTNPATNIDTLISTLDATGEKLCAIMNDHCPNREASWFRGGASASYSLYADSRIGLHVSLDAMHKNGKLYIRVQVQPFATSIDSDQFQAFQSLCADVGRLAQQLEACCRAAGFGTPG